MWRPMAEALGWPGRPVRWKTIVELAANPKGWEAVGHPEWGRFRLGYPHPGYSNVGTDKCYPLPRTERDNNPNFK